MDVEDRMIPADAPFGASITLAKGWSISAERGNVGKTVLFTKEVMHFILYMPQGLEGRSMTFLLSSCIETTKSRWQESLERWGYDWSVY